MSELVLYRYAFCPFAKAAHVALLAAGVPVRPEKLDRQHPPAWLKLASPLGTVPVLRFPDGGTLAESSAIAELAAALRPSLLPADTRGAAHAREARALVAEGYRALATWRRRAGDVAEARARVEAIASYLAARAREPFYFGPELGLVDAFALPFLERRQVLLALDGEEAPQPRLARWLDNLEAHDAARRVDAAIPDESTADYAAYAAGPRVYREVKA